METKEAYREAQRDGFCRWCDEEIQKGNKVFAFYSHRNRGQHILFHPECVKEMNKIVEEGEKDNAYFEIDKIIENLKNQPQQKPSVRAWGLNSCPECGIELGQVSAMTCFNRDCPSYRVVTMGVD